jgi:hypothetical protein
MALVNTSDSASGVISSDEHGLAVGVMERRASWCTWLSDGIVALLLRLLRNRLLETMPQLSVPSQTELRKSVDGLAAPGLAGPRAITRPFWVVDGCW